MSTSVPNLLVALAFVAVGLGLAAGGVYVGHTDDAPGASLLGLLLMIGSVTLGARIARRKG